MEHLIDWMEENLWDLKRKQLAWHKEVKDEVFAVHEHITIKKIGEKAGNMKKHQKQAKAKQDQSGWGVTLEDNTQSINKELEKTCTLFWCLDEIWRSCPNASTIPGSMDTGNLSQLIDPSGTDI